MQDYETGKLRYSDLKGSVSDAVWATVSAIQERREAFPPERVAEVLRDGANRARPLAQAKMAAVRERIGLLNL